MRPCRPKALCRPECRVSTSGQRTLSPDLQLAAPDAADSILAARGIGAEAPAAPHCGRAPWAQSLDMADLAGALQHIWAEHGIDVDIDIAPSAIDAERVARSQVPIFRKSWLADYPDAENFMGLFMPDRWSPNGPNYTHYANAEVTELLTRAAAMIPGRERQEVMRRAESKMLQDMPVIPLWHDQVVHLVSRQWEGWQVSPTNRLDLRRVRKSEGAQP